MIKSTLKNTLDQLDQLIVQIKPADYELNVDILSGSSLGMHVRHIIEFVECALEGEKTGVICYDSRKRDLALQSDVHTASARIKECSNGIESCSGNVDVKLSGTYCSSNPSVYSVKSSVERELQYNIEHAIHHMAIIKIAVRQVFPYVTIPDSFGVAHSTIQYEASQSA